MKQELESEQIIQNKVNAFNRLSHMKKKFIKKKANVNLELEFVIRKKILVERN